MAFKRFGNQTSEQVAAHLRSFLDTDCFNLEVDTFTGRAEVRKCVGGQGHSDKKERLRARMQGMSPSQRKAAMSAKRREKPKLKHVRNGRAITLKGYTGFVE
jgi:hypothetical protein